MNSVGCFVATLVFSYDQELHKRAYNAFEENINCLNIYKKLLLSLSNNSSTNWHSFKHKTFGLPLCRESLEMYCIIEIFHHTICTRVRCMVFDDVYNNKYLDACHLTENSNYYNVIGDAIV